MRTLIAALLLCTTVATPLIAQPGRPDRAEVREDRAPGFAGGRADVRPDRGPDDRRDGFDRGGFDRGDRPDRGRDARFDARPDGRRDPVNDNRRDRRGDDRRGDDRRGWAGSERPGPGWNDRRPNDPRWNGQGWNDPRWNGRDRYDGRWTGTDRGWNSGWRGDRRYDWQRYRQANRRAYALPRYYGPQGFGSYRRFGVGLRIGQPFYARSYWIADPFAYRLPPAYGNYRWVRYYDDVLLVDVYTGIVRDALYGFFL